MLICCKKLQHSRSPPRAYPQRVFRGLYVLIAHRFGVTLIFFVFFVYPKKNAIELLSLSPHLEGVPPGVPI